MRMILLSLALLSANAPIFAQGQANNATETKPAHHVVMYVLPNCGYCEKARAYFRDNLISWSEIDISSSEQANQDFKAKGGQGTPLIEIDGKYIQGFQEDKIAEALQLKS